MGGVDGETVARRRSRNRYFHRLVDRLIASQVTPGSRVIDIGCADGSTLRACRPIVGVGIDPDSAAIAVARVECPELTFLEMPVEGVSQAPLEAPDYVLLSMVLDEVYDIQEVMKQIQKWCEPDTRIVVASYSRLWRPVLRLAELLRIKSRAVGENYVPWVEVENILGLEGFEVTKRLDGVLCPVYIPILSSVVNRWIAPLPIFRTLSLMRITVARPLLRATRPIASVSVIVAARNESGHIEELITRVPIMAPRQELIFVEGNSTDDTWEVIQRAVSRHSEESGMSLKAIQQPGRGKGDAVRAGFEIAIGEVLIILDADISVPPEELPRFVHALANDVCEFGNGSRLVYPMDAKAMRFLNLLGNKFFGYVFTYLMGQPLRDTLCGTKALRRKDYQRIAANRSAIGELDPFGDFDLLFGASNLALRIRDIPVHYKERRYGETNISRFSHGILLIRMASIAASKLKFVG